MKTIKNSVSLVLKDQEGSAITEFLILTLPLFLPLVIFLTDFSALANREINYQTIARQAIRAFVSSSNATTGLADLEFILRETGIINSVDLGITCVDGPCFTQNTLVKLTLSKKILVRADSMYSTHLNSSSGRGSERTIVASVYERFDRWFSP